MDKKKSNFFRLSEFMIIVTKLTTKVNQVTIQAYDEYVDGY